MEICLNVNVNISANLDYNICVSYLTNLNSIMFTSVRNTYKSSNFPRLANASVSINDIWLYERSLK